MMIRDKVLIDREDALVTVLVQAKVVHERASYFDGYGTKPAESDVVILETTPLLNKREETLVLELLRNKHLP